MSTITALLYAAAAVRHGYALEEVPALVWNDVQRLVAALRR
jgi:hypothetical protein